MLNSTDGYFFTFKTIQHNQSWLSLGDSYDDKLLQNFHLGYWVMDRFLCESMNDDENVPSLEESSNVFMDFYHAPTVTSQSLQKIVWLAVFHLQQASFPPDPANVALQQMLATLRTLTSLEYAQEKFEEEKALKSAAKDYVFQTCYLSGVLEAELYLRNMLSWNEEVISFSHLTNCLKCYTGELDVALMALLISKDDQVPKKMRQSLALLENTEKRRMIQASIEGKNEVTFLELFKAFCISSRTFSLHIDGNNVSKRQDENDLNAVLLWTIGFDSKVITNKLLRQISPVNSAGIIGQACYLAGAQKTKNCLHALQRSKNYLHHEVVMGSFETDDLEWIKSLIPDNSALWKNILRHYNEVKDFAEFSPTAVQFLEEKMARLRV